MRHLIPALLVTLGLALGIVACGDDESEADLQQLSQSYRQTLAPIDCE